jgi:hypothetical protein
MQNNVPPAGVEPSAFPQKNISSPDWLEELAITLAQNLRLVPPRQHYPFSRAAEDIQGGAVING